MRVIKRNGRHESVSFDKILRKNTSLTATAEVLATLPPQTPFYKMISQLAPLDEVDPSFITQQTIRGIHDEVTTQELDVYSASVAQSLSLNNPQYSTLAGRIMASNLQKNIECQLSISFGVSEDVISDNLFLYVTRALWQNKNVNGEHSPLIAPYYMAYVEKNHQWFEQAFNYSRDYNIDYMGYSILESTYLFKTLLLGVDGNMRRTVVEQPQHMYMRVALGIECAPVDPTGAVRDDIESRVRNMISEMSAVPGTAIDPKNLINSIGPFLENVVINDSRHSAEQLFQSYMQNPDACLLSDSQKQHILATYNMMSNGLGTHATPTLYNAGTMTPQCSSCYLLAPPEDSMEGITASWRSEAMISKWAGGIGSIAYSLRPQGSYIAGTNGASNGIVPNLKVHNDIAVYVDQCFEASTIVYTLRGPQPISDVLVGDHILTSDSTYHMITAKREYSYQNATHGPLLRICTGYSVPTIVTSIHPMYVIDTTGRESVTSVLSAVTRGLLKPQYVPSGDLHKKHMMVWPIPSTTIDKPEIAASDHYRMGLLGYAPHIHLPLDKIRSYLIGLFEARVVVNDAITVVVRSEIVESIRYICLRLGFPVSSYLDDGDTTLLAFPPVPEVLKCIPLTIDCDVQDITTYFVYDGNIYIPITQITSQVPEAAMLYDFDVSVREDYMTQLGIAHNGGGKRPGSNAVYCTPWHGDIMAFLQLRKERGVESERARDLFYAMWIQDEFMRTVVADRDWYLMCPNQCPGLYDVYDQKYSSTWLSDAEVNQEDYAFTYLYRKYVQEGKYLRVVKATEIFQAIMDLQIETGLPYMLYADAANRKSNQKNAGIIHSSNLCTEIMEVTSRDETAVCNLASICLNNFYNPLVEGKFDYTKFRSVVRTIVYNLNRIIDLNFYPTTNTRRSNLRHRPMGIGVQGLADLFVLMRVPFDSEEARVINYSIFEHLYYYALEMSNELSQTEGTYPSWEGCPASKGVLQYDLWIAEAAKTVSGAAGENTLSFPLTLNWTELKNKIVADGLRNSLFVAPMPTASTAGIMGNSPCFEPFNSLIYKRRIKDGEFIIINKSLINDLLTIGLWDSEMRDEILLKGGSIQEIHTIPKEIRDLYKTSWDISPKAILIMALDRGVFVDQSQSMNLFIHAPNVRSLSQVHLYGWRRGIKTGSYYIWGRSPIDAQKIQIDKGVGKMLKAVQPNKSPQKSTNTLPPPAPVEGAVCTREAGCMSCGS